MLTSLFELFCRTQPENATPDVMRAAQLGNKVHILRRYLDMIVFHGCADDDDDGDGPSGRASADEVDRAFLARVYDLQASGRASTARAVQNAVASLRSAGRADVLRLLHALGPHLNAGRAGVRPAGSSPRSPMRVQTVAIARPMEFHTEQALLLLSVVGVPVQLNSRDHVGRAALTRASEAGAHFQRLEAMTVYFGSIAQRLFEDPLQAFVAEVRCLLEEAMQWVAAMLRTDPVPTSCTILCSVAPIAQRLRLVADVCGCAVGHESPTFDGERWSHIPASTQLISFLYSKYAQVCAGCTADHAQVRRARALVALAAAAAVAPSPPRAV